MASKNPPVNATQKPDQEPQIEEVQAAEVSFFGANFNSKKGEVGSEIFSELPIVCLYFAAKSSPPCRIFTPVLMSFYREINLITKTFEIIYVPRDKDQESYLTYLQQMPWISIPLDEEQRILDFKQRYKIQGIPSLVVLGAKGELITLDGRKDIIEKGEQAFESWMRKLEEIKGSDPDAMQIEPPVTNTQIIANSST